MSRAVAIIQKVPPSCCGVIRAGWEAPVKERVQSHTRPDDTILILEDNTLVWASEVILKREK